MFYDKMKITRYLIFSLFFWFVFIMASNEIKAQTAVKSVLENPSNAVTDITYPQKYLVALCG